MYFILRKIFFAVTSRRSAKRKKEKRITFSNFFFFKYEKSREKKRSLFRVKLRQCTHKQIKKMAYYLLRTRSFLKLVF